MYNKLQSILMKYQAEQGFAKLSHLTSALRAGMEKSPHQMTMFSWEHGMVETPRKCLVDAIVGAYSDNPTDWRYRLGAELRCEFYGEKEG